jgi:thiol-disulfide isomerase/thioredoxin
MSATGGPTEPVEPALPPDDPPTAPARRGVVGPFSARQLLLAGGVVAAVAVALVLLTRPIASAPGAGVPTALPGATPYLVSSPGTGLQVGQLAPELAWTASDGSTVRLTDLDGNPVRLADLRGKLVWLNFWATWCPPCQGETPVLRDMDEAYGDRGLAIVAIAVQETSVDNVRDYADRYELGYTIAFDASADIFNLYRVYALPTQVFIGPDGIIRQVVNGPLTDQTARAWIDGLLPASSPGVLDEGAAPS